MKDEEQMFLDKIKYMIDLYQPHSDISKLIGNPEEILNDLITALDIVREDLLKCKRDVTEYITFVDKMKQDMLDNLKLL